MREARRGEDGNDDVDVDVDDGHSRLCSKRFGYLLFFTRCSWCLLWDAKDMKLGGDDGSSCKSAREGECSVWICGGCECWWWSPSVHSDWPVVVLSDCLLTPNMTSPIQAPPPPAPSRPHATTIHTMEAVDVSQQFTGTCPSSLLRLPCHTTNP